MIWLLILVIASYCLIISVMIYGISQIHEPTIENNQHVSVTVLLPVRNEEKGIVETVKSILANDYHDFELLVLDDHSSDETAEQVTAFGDVRISLITLSDLEIGKKAALTKGVGLANGELIICTDSDSRVTAQWIGSHVNAFRLGNQLSFGPVRYFGQNSWVSLLNVELSALVGVGAATSALGKPSMINGCNYAFAKSAFVEVNGFMGNEKIASGDDEFLLRKMTQKYPNKILFLSNPDALVQTEAPSSLREFYHQRKRWASKWKHHKDLLSQTMPFLIFGIYGVMLVTSFYFIVQFPCLVGGLLGCKFLVDYLFLRRAVKICDNHISVSSFLVLQIIYPFYVVFFGIASNFGKFQWRNRTYRI